MIEGTLVNLRQREMSDLDRVYRWVNDPEVTGRTVTVIWAISPAMIGPRLNATLVEFVMMKPWVVVAPMI